VVGLIPNKKVNAYYLELIMRTHKERLNELAPQAAQKNINIEILKDVSIPLPPLSEQQQIVTRIEQEQKLVNGNKQLIALYEQKIKNEINKLWSRDIGKPKEYEMPEEILSIAAEE
jgi:restriction endonuclease S subunit